MKIINLTPHKINFIVEAKNIEIPSVGTIRLEEKIETVGKFNDIPTIKKEFCSPIIEGNIPEMEDEKVIVLVSMIIGTAPKEIKNQIKNKLQQITKAKEIVLAAPDTGPQSAIRNEKGQIIGVKRMILI